MGQHGKGGTLTEPRSPFTPAAKFVSIPLKGYELSTRGDGGST